MGLFTNWLRASRGDLVTSHMETDLKSGKELRIHSPYGFCREPGGQCRADVLLVEVLLVCMEGYLSQYLWIRFSTFSRVAAL